MDADDSETGRLVRPSSSSSSGGGGGGTFSRVQQHNHHHQLRLATTSAASARDQWDGHEEREGAETPSGLGGQGGQWEAPLWLGTRRGNWQERWRQNSASWQRRWDGLGLSSAALASGSWQRWRDRRGPDAEAARPNARGPTPNNPNWPSQNENDASASALSAPTASGRPADRVSIVAAAATAAASGLPAAASSSPSPASPSTPFSLYEPLLPHPHDDNDPGEFLDDDGSSIRTLRSERKELIPYLRPRIADSLSLLRDALAQSLRFVSSSLGLTSPKPTPGSLRIRLIPEKRRSRIFAMFLIVTVLLLGGFVHYMWRVEAALAMPWIPDPDSRLFGQRPLLPPRLETSITTYELPLHTKGRDIVDENGKRFKLLSVNWYGASDEQFVPGGLDIQHRSVIARTIRKLGFNSVRMPYSDELVMTNPYILPHLVAANPDLIGLKAMDVFEAIVESLTDAGLAVIINNHITSAQWCCGADPCDAGWANDHLGPLCRVTQTEEEWIQHWEVVMARFVENPLVIGADLRNEVRGLWGTMPWERWAAAAEKCGNRLLKMKSDWLIIVGGTESGNDLSGAEKRPVVLDVAHRLVYSAHVYAWSGWGSVEGRYSRRSYASFVKSMRHNWAYLVEKSVAPVWVGEFGAPHHPSIGDANYWQNLLRYLKVLDADFGYWAINPRKPKDNERETYALVEDDWVTPVLDYRMKDMVEIMRS